METEAPPQIEGPIGDTPTAPAHSVEVVTDPTSNSVSPIPNKHDNNNVADVISAAPAAQETIIGTAQQPISISSVVAQGGVSYIPTEQVAQAVDLVTRHRHIPVEQSHTIPIPISVAPTEQVEQVVEEEVPAEQVQTQVVMAPHQHQNPTGVATLEHGVLPAAVAAHATLPGHVNVPGHVTVPGQVIPGQVALPGQVGVALPPAAHQQMHVHPVQLHTPTIIHVPSSEIKHSATPTATMAHSSYPSVITQHITQPSAVASVPGVVTSIQNVMATPQDQLAANAALLTQQLAAAGMLPIKTERLDPTKVYVSEYGKVAGVLNPALYASPALYTQQVVASAAQYPGKSESAAETAPPVKLYTSGQVENTASSQAAFFAQQVVNSAATGGTTKATTTTEPQIQTTNVGLSAALLMQQLAAGVLGYQLRGDLSQQLAGITGRTDASATAASHTSPLGLYSNQVSTITANPTLLSQPQVMSTTETNSKTVATPTGGILPSLFARPPGTFGVLSVASTPSQQQLQSASLVTNPAQMLYNFANANSATVPQFKTVDAVVSQSQAVNPATTQPMLAHQPADHLGLYPVKIQPLNPINGDEVEVQTETSQHSLPSGSLPTVSLPTVSLPTASLPSVNTLSTEGTSMSQEEVKSKVAFYQALDTTTCIVCAKTFKSRNNLKVHLRSHSGEKPYSCSTCGRSFTQSSSLNRHAKIHKQKKYRCKYCDTSFTKKRYLKEHKRTHKLERRAKQQVLLEEQIETVEEVEEVHEHQHHVHEHQHHDHEHQHHDHEHHVNEHHEHHEHHDQDHDDHDPSIKADPYVSAETRTLEKPFKCPQCHITFALSVDLRQHVGTHIGQKPVPVACRYCSKEFQHSWDLKCHERTHHSVVEEVDESKPKTEACRWCGQEFQHSWDLKCHEASHHLAAAEEPVVQVPLKDPAAHMCRFCHKTFTRRGVLKRHERIHTGERPYVCPHCKKGFAVGNNLKQHIRTHTGEKPYTCDTCGRAFAQGSSLKRHQAIHEKDGLVVPKVR